jgi:DNA-binding LytR/AlgR family response regulator
MPSPTAIIAEDETVLRAELRDKLAQLWPELVISAEAGDGIEALRAVGEHMPQVLFLDIQMPGLNGLEVAQQVSGKAHIVFITAHDHHAIEAFERGAIDYVQKPIVTSRLATAVGRLKERLRAMPQDVRDVTEKLRNAAAQGGDYLKWLTVAHGHELRVVTTEEICYLRADNKYASIVTAASEFLITSTLKEMRERLDPKSFWQVHRSVVVNVAAIRAIQRGFKGTLEIQLKQRPETLPVSAAYAHLFKHL